jgi:hypothetical protein
MINMAEMTQTGKHAREKLKTSNSIFGNFLDKELIGNFAWVM